MSDAPSFYLVTDRHRQHPVENTAAFTAEKKGRVEVKTHKDE